MKFLTIKFMHGALKIKGGYTFWKLFNYCFVYTEKISCNIDLEILISCEDTIFLDFFGWNLF